MIANDSLQPEKKGTRQLHKVQFIDFQTNETLYQTPEEELTTLAPGEMRVVLRFKINPRSQYYV